MTVCIVAVKVQTLNKRSDDGERGVLLGRKSQDSSHQLPSAQANSRGTSSTPCLSPPLFHHSFTFNGIFIFTPLQKSSPPPRLHSILPIPNQYPPSPCRQVRPYGIPFHRSTLIRFQTPLPHFYPRQDALNRILYPPPPTRSSRQDPPTLCVPAHNIPNSAYGHLRRLSRFLAAMGLIRYI